MRALIRPQQTLRIPGRDAVVSQLLQALRNGLHLFGLGDQVKSQLARLPPRYQLVNARVGRWRSRNAFCTGTLDRGTARVVEVTRPLGILDQAFKVLVAGRINAIAASCTLRSLTGQVTGLEFVYLLQR